MAGNTFGKLLRVTTFGESHGAAIGAVLDGCPAGIPLATEDFVQDLAKRHPRNDFETSRREPDTPEILSGVFEGKTLGTPIAVLLRNAEARPHDYEKLKDVYRPGHADFAYEAKYRRRDWRGGGRASGRETAARVLAGTVAKKILVSFLPAELPLTITVSAVEIAGIPCAPLQWNSPLPSEIREKLTAVKKAGDSAGAVLSCEVTGVPVGLGEPVFEKLDAELAKAMLSIGAVKGIEFGSGFELCRMAGSEANGIHRQHQGGIAGGISDGTAISFRLAVKPVPSIAKEQQAYTADRSVTECTIEGRHDVCLFRRIIPVAEAMTALVFADMLLQQRAAIGMQ